MQGTCEMQVEITSMESLVMIRTMAQVLESNEGKSDDTSAPLPRSRVGDGKGCCEKDCQKLAAEKHNETAVVSV